MNVTQSEIAISNNDKRPFVGAERELKYRAGGQPRGNQSDKADDCDGEKRETTPFVG
jgi:hypothetical protein